MKTGRIAIKIIFCDFKSCRWRYVSRSTVKVTRTIRQTVVAVSSSTARGSSFESIQKSTSVVMAAWFRH